MMIMHSDGKSATNSDNVTRLSVNGCYVTAYMNDGSNHQIGKYQNAELAQDAFIDILYNIKRGNK